MFPAQLKIKSESSGRQRSLLPRQPFSWLPITQHNSEQFLPPAAASKQQKWTVLHSLTMTVCTRLFRPQKAMVALLSLVSLTLLFFFQEEKKKKGKLARVLAQQWAQANCLVHVRVPAPGPPLSSLLITLLHLSFPCLNLLASQAAEIIIPESVFPSHEAFIPTRSSFVTVGMLKYLC